MTILALVVYVIAAVVTMGLRAVVRARDSGDSGIRSAGGGGGVGALARPLTGVAFMMSLVSILADFSGMARVSGSDRDWLGVAGLIVAAAGIAIVLYSQFGMGDSWRMGVDESEKTALVTSGPFRIVRNPISTGMFVTLLGISLMVPNAFALAAMLLLLIALELRVRLVEEPHLRTIHSEAFDEYAKRVGRFIPGVGRGR